jgi:hypothetical protein
MIDLELFKLVLGNVPSAAVIYFLYRIDRRQSEMASFLKIKFGFTHE